MTAAHADTNGGAEPHRPAAGAVTGDAEERRPGGTAAQGDPEGRWVAAHLFHFGDLDPLITGVVDPVTRELAADGTAAAPSSCATGRAASTCGSGWRCRTRPAGRASAT